MKFKSRFKKRELKEDFFSRTKKAFSLTPSERGSIVKTIKKVPVGFKTYSKRVDFGNLYGRPLKKPIIKKIKRKKKKQQYITVRIKR